MPPAPPGQEFQLTVQVKGRLTDPEEFGNIIVRTGSGAEIVRVRDVGRVELGSQSYGAFTRLNGKSTCTIQIFQLPGANALNVVKQLRKLMGGKTSGRSGGTGRPGGMATRPEAPGRRAYSRLSTGV